MNTSLQLPSILLVEDNEDDYEATLRSFKYVRLDNPIHWCSSGKEALEYLKREGQYGDLKLPLPTLILLDLNMPGIDGKKVLEIVKAHSKLKKIPVVVLTTSNDEHDINSCYELGASTYIQKPVEFDGLLNAVKEIKEYWFGIALLPKEVLSE